MSTIRVGWISDSHLGCLQYGLAARENDFFLGLQAALKKLIVDVKVDTIVHTGDIFHAARLTSNTWNQFRQLHDWLVDVKIACWVIEGNHDQAEPPWLMYNRETVGGFKLLDNFDAQEDPVTGLIFCGCRALPVEEMRKRLLAAPVCDLLLVHALVREFVDFELPGALSLADFPSDRAQMVCLGDLHIRKFLPFGIPSKKTRAMTEAGYPGSTELGSSAEEEDKTVEVLYFDSRTKRLQKHEAVNFPTRPVLRHSVRTSAELTELLTELAAWKPVQKHDPRYPLLFLSHAPEVNGVREAVTRALDLNKWLVRLSLLDATPEGGTSVLPPLNMDRLQMQAVLEETLAPGSSHLLPIMTRLVDASSEIGLEVMNSYIEKRMAA